MEEVGGGRGAASDPSGSAGGTAAGNEAPSSAPPEDPSGSGGRAPRTPAAPPFGASVGAWSWVDVPESTCANGEPTGLGVNLGTGSDVVVFLVGGGGCWDAATCFGLGTAMNIKDGYRKKDFEADLEGFLKPVQDGSGGLFDRTLPDNPFKDSSFVFIPYCTGDVHAGDAVREYSIPPRKVHFAGRKNIEAFVKRIAPAFANASRVTLAGVSAGGFGAAINYWRFQDAFAPTRVDLIDDSGPILEQADMPLYPIWKQAWNMDGALPPGCAGCKTNIAALPAYYSSKYPASRLALLSYELDNVMSLFFLQTQQGFAGNLKAALATKIAPRPNMRYYLTSGSGHVLSGDLQRTSGGVKLATWLGEMASGSPAWGNVAP